MLENYDQCTHNQQFYVSTLLLNLAVSTQVCIHVVVWHYYEMQLHLEKLEIQHLDMDKDFYPF